MKNLKDKLVGGMQRFMYGRNGQDAFARDIYMVSLVLLIVTMFFRNGLLYYVGLAGFIYSMFRMISKNIPARQKENQRYLEWKWKVEARVRVLKRQWRERKTHRYYACPTCHQMTRVPKGKGQIEIRCPKCGTTFVKKT